MTDFAEWDYKISAPAHFAYQCSESHQDRYVTCPQGIVAVSVERFPHTSYTRMEFAVNGRVYSRSWKREWGRKTITRLAREMAEDVMARKENRLEAPPLQWTAKLESFLAPVVFGCYHVEPSRDGGFNANWYFDGLDRWYGIGATQEEAKVLCQEHWNRKMEEAFGKGHSRTG